MELVIEITDRCNNNCIHCSSDSSRSKSAFLPVPVIERTIDEIKPAAVILSGGEPFLHPEIEAVIDIAKKAGARLAVNTCGVVRHSDIPLNFNKVDEFYVSWFGEARDITRFCPQLSFVHPFDIVMAAKRLGIKAWINTVVIGAWQIIDIPRACFDLEVPLHVMRLVPHGRATRMKGLSLQQQRAVAAAMIDQLDPVKARKRPPAFLCRRVEEVLPDDIRRLEAVYPSCKMSHSLVPGECRSAGKRTLLPDGRLIGCVAGKGRDETVGKYRACD